MADQSYFVHSRPTLSASNSYDVTAPLQDNQSNDRLQMSTSTPQSPFDDVTYPSYTDGRSETRYGSRNDLSRPPLSPFDDSFQVPSQPHRPRKGPDIYRANLEPGMEEMSYSSPEDRRKEQTRRFFKGKIPWVVYILTAIQVGVFIAEIVKNAILTGSPIEIHPQFNPMIGPSPYVLINMGARYVPCMRNEDQVQNSDVRIYWPCPNQTAETPSCTLSDLCGFSGVPNPHPNGSLSDSPAPNQWFRFITPIFLHAGVIHISFNMLLQILLGKDMEKAIGSIRFALVYFSSGVFGFVMGGNFAAPGIASTGASGCLFGIIALVLLDLLYTWRSRKHPLKDLFFIVLDIAISFVLGLLPGLDNFSHIGGFLMGLVLGVCLLHSPNALRKRTGDALSSPGTYSGSFDAPRLSNTRERHRPGGQIETGTTPASDFAPFFQSPVRFFAGRRPLWWIWWLLRAGALIGVLVAFVILINSFYRYHSSPCSWCKYLSCLDVNGWCDIGNLQFTPTNSTNSLLRRDL